MAHQREMMCQQREFWSQMAASLNCGNFEAQSGSSAFHMMESNEQAIASARSKGLALSSIPTAQAISLLSTQIPLFSGGEDDNIELWLEKVERVA